MSRSFRGLVCFLGMSLSQVGHAVEIGVVKWLAGNSAEIQYVLDQSDRFEVGLKSKVEKRGSGTLYNSYSVSAIFVDTKNRLREAIDEECASSTVDQKAELSACQAKMNLIRSHLDQDGKLGVVYYRHSNHSPVDMIEETSSASGATFPLKIEDSFLRFELLK